MSVCVWMLSGRGCASVTASYWQMRRKMLKCTVFVSLSLDGAVVLEVFSLFFYFLPYVCEVEFKGNLPLPAVVSASIHICCGLNRAVKCVTSFPSIPIVVSTSACLSNKVYVSCQPSTTITCLLQSQGQKLKTLDQKFLMSE